MKKKSPLSLIYFPKCQNKIKKIETGFKKQMIKIVLDLYALLNSFNQLN